MGKFLLNLLNPFYFCFENFYLLILGIGFFMPGAIWIQGLV